MKPSEQQQQVIDWALKGKGNLNLVARAGCGKSSTLVMVVEALHKANPRQRIFMGAFNRPIAVELGEKLRSKGLPPNFAEASTMHSAGLRAWRKVNGWRRYSSQDKTLDEGKVWQWVDTLPAEQAELYGGFCKNLISLAKQNGFGFLRCEGLANVDDWRELVAHHSLDDNLTEAANVADGIRLAIQGLRWSNSVARQVIDFDDMLYAPMFFGARPEQYDWVCIDEAQDTNPVRRALALAMLKPGGRLIAVGDDRQAIYGFTGADADAMDQIRRQLNSAVMPLNVTYRCPKAVVAVAQELVGDIEAHESAPAGEVRTIGADALKLTELRPGADVVLCRINAPLVSMAYRCIGQGIPAKLEGRDLAEGLVGLMRKWKTNSLAAFDQRLQGWYERELSKAQAKGQGSKAQGIEDKYETVMALAVAVRDRYREEATVEHLVSFTKELFGIGRPNGRPAVGFSSIHKAKGKEWPTVYLLGANEYMPSPWARQRWEQVQEDNLMYVAVTRAQQRLVFVDTDSKAKAA